jgi:hypothetical protein
LNFVFFPYSLSMSIRDVVNILEIFGNDFRFVEKPQKTHSPNETSPRLLVEITILPGELPAAPAPAPSPSLEDKYINRINI